jgi:hypothetical protein
MPAYESSGFRPPAPVAFVIVRSPIGNTEVSNVPMLLDSGADVSFVPRQPIAALIDSSQALPEYEIEAFDGTKSRASMVNLEIEFLGKSFRGQFLLLDGTHGFLGRNILNKLSLLFDGPRLNWSENR